MQQIGTALVSVLRQIQGGKNGDVLSQTLDTLAAHNPGESAEMNAEVNVASERALHPLAVNSESRQVLAHWLKSNGTRQIREADPRRMMIERYPVGLFSEAELQALWDVMEG